MRGLCAGAALAVVALGFVIFELRTPARAPTIAATAAPALPSPQPPASVTPPASDARPQIRAAIAAITPTLESPRDLDRYVEGLEQRARREHRLAAVDVEPGFEAIRRMRSQVGAERSMQLQAEYVQRLNRLAADVEPR